MVKSDGKPYYLRMERSGDHRRSRGFMERLKQTSSSYLPAADTVWIATSVEMLTTAMDRGNIYLLSTLRFGRILPLSDLCLILGLFHEFSPTYKLRQEQCYWFCRLVLDLAMVADPQAFVRNEKKSKRAGRFGNIAVGQSSITSRTFRDTFQALIDLAPSDKEGDSDRLPLVTRALSFSSDEAKSRAANTLSTLIHSHPTIKPSIAGTGAILSLVAMLSSSSIFIKRDAAIAMVAVVDSCVVNQEEAKKAGAFSALAPLLSLDSNLPAGTPTLRSLAANAIASIVSESSSSQKASITEKVVPALYHVLNTEGSENHASITKALAVLTTSEAGKKAARTVDLLFLLFELLASTSSDVRQHAMTTIENITSGSAQETIPTLVKLLRSSIPNAELHALGKIAELTKSRNGVLSALGLDAMPPLIKLLSSSQVSTQRQATAALANIAFYDAGSATALKAGALPSLVRLLSSHSSNVQHQAALAIGHITFSTDGAKLLAVEAGALQPLIGMFSSSVLDIQIAASRAIAFISTVKAGRIGILKADIVPNLVISLSSEQSDVHQYAATIAASIATSDEGREALLEWGAVPLLIKLLSSPSPAAHKQAVLAIARISTSPLGKLAAMNGGALPPLKKLLVSPVPDVRQRATEAITNMVGYAPVTQVRPVILVLESFIVGIDVVTSIVILFIRPACKCRTSQARNDLYIN
jgi:HEAT repeat protein